MLRRPRTRMMAEAVYGPILDPFVTVVVPMYNEADCIADCARSVLGQDFAPLELLVVDDGSADGSAAICENLGVTGLRQDHRGPGTARNLGARHPRGHILVFADADIVLPPDHARRARAPIAGRGAGA